MHDFVYLLIEGPEPTTQDALALQNYRLAKSRVLAARQAAQDRIKPARRD